MSKYHDQISLYYDKDGKPISMDKWIKSLEDMSYRIIDMYDIGPYHVSTVWLGLNHNVVGEPIFIFETMIFHQDDDETDKLHLFQERYSTLTEAVNGHERAVKMVIEAVNRTDPVHREVEDRMD